MSPASAKIVRINSNNDVFQRLFALAGNRKKRYQARQCIVEGVKPINLAISNGWTLGGVAYTQGDSLSGWAKDILASPNASGATRYELAPDLMKEFSDKEEASELIAIIDIPEDGPDRVKIGTRGVPIIVALDQPSSPGNLGSVIRSCDAFRADGVLVIGHSADVYDPEAIRASLGTVFATPAATLPSTEHLLRWLEPVRESYRDLKVVGTSAKADMDISNVDFSHPTVLMLGNETRGLSWNAKQACDIVARIPIYGAASSLNLASAASIALYEIDSQRRRAKL